MAHTPPPMASSVDVDVRGLDDGSVPEPAGVMTCPSPLPEVEDVEDDTATAAEPVSSTDTTPLWDAALLVVICEPELASVCVVTVCTDAAPAGSVNDVDRTAPEQQQQHRQSTQTSEQARCGAGTIDTNGSTTTKRAT